MTSYFNIICPEDRQLQPKPHDLDSSYAAAAGLWRAAFGKAVSIVSHAPTVQSSHNSNALSAHCYVPCLQTHLCNKQAFSSLRWEKDKDNTAAEQKSSFWGLLPWGSISLCHRKLKLQQVLPGSSSKPLSANTAIPAYMTCILFSVHPTNTKTFCLFTQRMRSPCSLDQQIRLNKLQGKRTKLYLPFKTI